MTPGRAVGRWLLCLEANLIGAYRPEEHPSNLFNAMRFDQGTASDTQDLSECDILPWSICVASDAVKGSLQKDFPGFSSGLGRRNLATGE